MIFDERARESLAQMEWRFGVACWGANTNGQIIAPLWLAFFLFCSSSFGSTSPKNGASIGPSWRRLSELSRSLSAGLCLRPQSASESELDSLARGALWLPATSPPRPSQSRSLPQTPNGAPFNDRRGRLQGA